MSDSSSPFVHALLVCRRVETQASGEISLHNVLEVLPVDSVPGDVGPIAIVAFVRNLPPGQATGAFLLRPEGNEAMQARMPLEVNVPEGFGGRQIALQVELPSLPVGSGGWFEFGFEWDGELLAINRFAVGARSAGE